MTIPPELDEYASRFACEFEGGLANHEPMALRALELLGASGAQLRSFSRNYHSVHVLDPLPADGSGAVAEIDAILGDRDMEAQARRYFGRVLASDAPWELVGEYLTRLAPGVCASAFHPLMRLAYATLHDDVEETARALAYWVVAYLEIPAFNGEEPVTEDPMDVLARVSRLPGLRDLPVHFLLWHNIREMASAPAFSGVGDWLEIDSSTLERMARSAVELYAVTGNFCALHALTGVHWIRVVSERWPDARDTLMKVFWTGVAALLGDMAWPELPDPADVARRRAAEGLPSWEQLKAAACDAVDEHDISIAYSAWREFQVYRDPLYRYAVAARLGLIDPGWPPSPYDAE